MNTNKIIELLNLPKQNQSNLDFFDNLFECLLECIKTNNMDLIKEAMLFVVSNITNRGIIRIFAVCLKSIYYTLEDIEFKKLYDELIFKLKI